MSDDLLRRFLSTIEEEDGITQRKKKKKDASVEKREEVKKVLRVAAKGKIELSPEESYIISKPSTSRPTFNDQLASKGVSLIEQARSQKPVDLKKRNLRYMKYSDSRKLDPGKAKQLVSLHLAGKEDKSRLRKTQPKLKGVKEPKRPWKGSAKKSKNSGSVFSESDFASVARKPRRVNSISDHSFL